MVMVVHTTLVVKTTKVVPVRFATHRILRRFTRPVIVHLGMNNVTSTALFILDVWLTSLSGGYDALRCQVFGYEWASNSKHVPAFI